MQTLKLCLSLPDDTHPDMELRVSTNDTEYDVVIAMPQRPRAEATAPAGIETAAGNEQDDYVLGGYAGI